MILKYNCNKEQLINYLKTHSSRYKERSIFSVNDDKILKFFIDGNDDIILYYDVKRLIFFSPPKIFHGQITFKYNVTYIKGKFIYKKYVRLFLTWNTIMIYLLICGSNINKYFNISDLLATLIISTLFTLIMYIFTELFSLLFKKNSYEYIIEFLKHANVTG